MKNIWDLPDKTTHEIFLSQKTSINFLKEHELIDSEKKCDKCGETMKIASAATYSNNLAYRCTSKKCHVRKPFLFGNLLSTPKIPLNSYFLAIYEILCRDYEKRILNDCGISKRSLQKIKDNCNEFFISKNEAYRNKVLGGQYAVQIDETVIYKGTLIF